MSYTVSALRAVVAQQPQRAPDVLRAAAAAVHRGRALRRFTDTLGTSRTRPPDGGCSWCGWPGPGLDGGDPPGCLDWAACDARHDRVCPPRPLSGYPPPVRDLAEEADESLQSEQALIRVLHEIKASARRGDDVLALTASHDDSPPPAAYTFGQARRYFRLAGHSLEHNARLRAGLPPPPPEQGPPAQIPAAEPSPRRGRASTRGTRKGRARRR